MFKLKHLILVASLVYVLVIGGGVVGFRYFVSLPELRQHADTLVEYEVQQTESALLRVEDELLKSLASDDFSHANLLQDASRMRFRYVGSLTALDRHLDSLTRANRIQPEVADEFLQLATLSSGSRVSYLQLSDTLFQLGVIRSSQSMRFIMTALDTRWLARINLELNASLSLILHDEQPFEISPLHVPLLDSKGDITAQVKITPKVFKPKLIDAQTAIGIVSLISLPLIITLLVATVFVLPVVQLIDAIKRMSHDNQPQKLKTQHYIYELGALTQAFNELLFKLGRQQQLLKHETLTDKLTGIANRRAFDQTLEHDWHFAMRTKIPLTLVLADIDHFKNYNDFYGHQAGDDALAAVALALRSCCRRATEFVARYGGEEFGFILQAEGDPNHFLESVNQAVRNLNMAHAKSSCAEILTISIGACTFYPDHSDDHADPVQLETIVKLADDALYKSKKSGRNRFSHVIYEHPRPN